MWRTEGGVANVFRRANLLGESEDWEERGKEEEEEDGEEEREDKAKAAGIAATAVAVVATDLRKAILLQLFLYLLHCSPYLTKQNALRAVGSYLYVCSMPLNSRRIHTSPPCTYFSLSFGFFSWVHQNCLKADHNI